MADFPEMLPISSRLREPLRHALAGKSVQWPEPLTELETRALVEHGVAPLVYSVTGIRQLRDEAIRAAAIEHLRLDDLREVLEALASRGVRPLLMKGTPLAYDIYAAPELRPRGDTDLLIDRQSIAAVRETMLALGFVERVTSGDEHAMRQMMFVRRDLSYDVHWDVTNSPLFASVLQFDELRERAVPVPAISEQAMTLCHTDALMLACIHRVAHHHDTERLIWLCDIALLRDRMSRDEHREFWRLAAERRVVAVCMRSIDLAGEWCMSAKHDLAADFLTREELMRDEPSRAFLDRDLTYGRVMLADLRALPWPARLQRLWQLAFPPPAFMQESFRARSRFALPWLYVYRGARGIVRLFRRA